VEVDRSIAFSVTALVVMEQTPPNLVHIVVAQRSKNVLNAGVVEEPNFGGARKIVQLTIHSPDKRAAVLWVSWVLSRRFICDSKFSAAKPFCG